MFMLLMFCIIIDLAPHVLCHVALSSYMTFYTLDHVEPESGVQAEQTQDEAISNLVLDQGKPGAFHQCACLLFETLLYILLDCALSP
jgi:hypothetical protein